MINQTFQYSGIALGAYLKPIPPIGNLPEGTQKVKIRTRVDEFVRVFVKTSSGITEWNCVERDGKLMLTYPRSGNLRLTT